MCLLRVCGYFLAQHASLSLLLPTTSPQAAFSAVMFKPPMEFVAIVRLEKLAGVGRKETRVDLEG